MDFRKHTLLPLDDCLKALQATVPSSPGRRFVVVCSGTASAGCPEVEGDQPRRKKFDTYPIGFFHIDLAELRTAEGKLAVFECLKEACSLAFSLCL